MHTSYDTHTSHTITSHTENLDEEKRPNKQQKPAMFGHAPPIKSDFWESREKVTLRDLKLRKTEKETEN